MVRRILFFLLIPFFAFTEDNLKVVDKEAYLKENFSSERKAILDFITNQFNGYSLSQKDLDELWFDLDLRRKQSLIRIQIVDQKLYVGDEDIEELFRVDLLTHLKKLVKKYKINDVDFIIYGRDEIVFDKSMDEKVKRIPAFMFSRNNDSELEKTKFLLPDAFLIKHNWRATRNEIIEARDKYPWDKKIEKVFWRGAASGRDFQQPYIFKNFNMTNFPYLERINLVMFSKFFHDLIDAEFINVGQATPNQDGQKFRKIISILFGGNLAAPVSKVEHLKYKYLISLDGYTCAWERVPWIMLSDSVLLKQETNNIEWFYPALKAYKNYVPINKKLTNLFEQIEWLKNNDSKLKEISKNAQNFVENNLAPDDIEIQTVIILNEYSKIQTNSNIQITLSAAENAYSFYQLFKLFMKKLYARVIKALW